jgi:hypothetical protein
VFDIHQDKFLMLLFVVQAQFQQIPQIARKTILFAFRVIQEVGHRGINMSAIGHHTVERWTGQQAAIRAGMLGPDRFVIGIEQEIKIGIEFRVSWRMGLQDKRFEKLGDVRKVPFRRTDIRHRLDLLVLGR